MKEIGQNVNKKTLYLTFWAESLQIDQQNVNLSMDSFLNNMNCIFDTYAPVIKS